MKQLPITIAAALLGVVGVQGQTTSPVSGQASAPSTMAAQAPAQGAQPRMAEDKRVKAEDIDRRLEEGNVLVLDVREPKEIDEFGGIEDALNIPIGQLEGRLSEVPKDRLILTA